MQLSDIRAAQPDLVRSGATELDRVRDALQDAADRIAGSVRRPLADGAWVGDASKAALHHIDGIQRRLTDAVDALTKAGQGVRQLADSLADAKQLVARADQIAARERLTIGEDGSVTFPSNTEPVSQAEAQATRAAGTEAHDLLGRAITMARDADELCASTLSEAGVADADASEVGALAGAAVGAQASTGEQSGGEESGGVGDTLHDMFFGDHEFEDSALGDAVSDWSEGDRSFLERVFVDPDGRMDPFDLEPWEEELVAETPLGATPDELLGEEVVDTIHEEGVAAGPGAWWDQQWEDISNIPDRIGEGVENFADDPVGTIVGAFTD